MAADPLQLLDICTTSDGAAALIDRGQHKFSPPIPRLAVRKIPSVRAITITPHYPQLLNELPYITTDFIAVAPTSDRAFKDQILDTAYT